MNRIKKPYLIAASLLMTVAGCTQDTGKPVVPDTAELLAPFTVSGISAGAYMAVQTHMALGHDITGVAAIAGGPYHCAEGSVTTALGPCLSGTGLNVESLTAFARTAIASGNIAGVDKTDRVWIFHGAKDSVVQPSLSVALETFYMAFLPAGQVRRVDTVPAAHGWPTVDEGGACADVAPDFVNACGYDAAGELLGFLYGDLEPAATASAAPLRRFDQTTLGGGKAHMADEGMMFVPAHCEAGGDCRVHVVFHGCKQGEEFTGERFATRIGVNEWADANRIVVIYPQIQSSTFNPLGCWDWWGYTGKNYDLASGAQISVIRNIVAAWGAGTL